MLGTILIVTLVQADCFCSFAGYLVDGGDHWATRSGVIYALSSSERTGDC
jgi:hypothetical protein